MHILILEARLTGHHPVYLEKISSGFIEAGHVVTVGVSTKDTQHPLIANLCARHEGQIYVQPISDAAISSAMAARFGVAGREFAMRKLFAQTFSQVTATRPVDHVLLPYLDYCLYAIALLGAPFGKTPWSGICMRPSFHYVEAGVIAPMPKFSTAKQHLFFRLLRNRSLKRLFTIDELLHAHAIKHVPAWKSKIQYLPDPAELKGSHTRESARQALGISEDQKVILVYGAIDARKGLTDLLNAFRSPKTPSNTTLIVAGKQSDWAREILSQEIAQNLRARKNLIELNNFVSEEQQQMLFFATDAVWLGYINHYSMSGVLILTALAKAQAISTREGLIGYYTQKWNAGFVIDTKNAGQIFQFWPNKPSSINHTNFDPQAYSWRMALGKITDSLLL